MKVLFKVLLKSDAKRHLGSPSLEFLLENQISLNSNNAKNMTSVIYQFSD